MLLGELITPEVQVDVMGSNPKGVVGKKIVGRSKNWPHPSTPLMFTVDTWVNAFFLTTIPFKRGPTITTKHTLSV